MLFRDAPQSIKDEKWVRQALQLAERSVGLASPNPVVGCVMVLPDGINGIVTQTGGTLVGEGWHEYDRLDHAEIVGLAQAGERARGATAYVTLEPCSHHGRTGPCADALIRAGVARVVAATTDPNPLVSGQGLAKLRTAGIDVVVGVREEDARRLNDAFAKYIRTGLPLVTLKAALSLDGRIAPVPSLRKSEATPFWLTGNMARHRVQQMRHASDAILTGINTILDDDPSFSDRTGLPRRRPLLRVVLDSHLRLPLTSKLVQSANADVLVFCTEADAARQEALEAAGVRIEVLKPGTTQSSDRVSLRQSITRLGELQMTSVMIEAGAQINTSALRDGLVDRLSLFYAPLPLGAEGLPFLHGVPEETLADPAALNHLFDLDNIRREAIEPDTLYEGWRDEFWTPFNNPD
ncbi:MAG TPA: bifunctional diaminohydroxyphosphoribosylaminopyrimidine deaminase/5-amino-6-(5-phosphoribosylamino)uracil reductase RibD [Acidisarcina sp.]